MRLSKKKNIFGVGKVKKQFFYILFLLFSISLKADYCIQVATVNDTRKNYIINKASSKKYNQFNAVRVERRGRYLTFRIGDYSRFKDAQQDAYKLRKINKGAYIRKCNFNKKKVLYSKKKFQRREEAPSYYTNVQVQKKVNNSEALWGECKKCFIPVYKNEDDSENNVPKLPLKEHSKDKIEKHDIVVHIKEKAPTQDTFWHDETRKSTPVKIQKPKPNNKFNIDEQFLN